MPLHVYSFTNLETNKWNQQSMLWRNSKECVVSENSFSKNFVNFQEKRPGEIAFLNKVTGYLTLTYWECSSGKFIKFSEQLSQETPANAGFCN